MAKPTQDQIETVVQIIIEEFKGNPNLFREALSQIVANTNEVTRQNAIRVIRQEIRAFTEEKEAEIQTLLGM